MIKRNVVFNEIKLIFKKSQTIDSTEAKSMKNDSMKNVDLTDLLQSVRVKNTDLQQLNTESNQSIIAFDQVIESMLSILNYENDENVVSMFENDQASSAKNFFAENSNSIEVILSNQKNKLLNSLIMIELRKRIRHDYKKLHTKKSNRDRERDFVKAAIIVSHQIFTFATYEEAISRS